MCGPVLGSARPCVFSWVSLSYPFVKLHSLFPGFLLPQLWGGIPCEGTLCCVSSSRLLLKVKDQPTWPHGSDQPSKAV